MIASTVMITDVFMPYFTGIEESGVLLVRSRPSIEITPLSSFQEGLGLPTYVATMLVACVATRRPRARSTLGATLAGCSELLSLKGSVKVSIDWLRKPAYPFAASRLVRSSPCCRMPRGGRLCPVATALLLAGSLLAQAQLDADVSNAELVRRYCAGSSSSAFFRTAPRLTVSATPTRSRSVRTEMLPSRLPPPPGPPVLCSALF